jgi:hypothetical protein
MAVTLNASTSSGLVQTADTSGTVEIQSNGTTRLTVASGGVTTTGNTSIANLTATGTFGGGVITSGTAVASTSGTSIDFTGIPSWVKRITVMFSGVSTGGSSALIVQLGTSGGFVSTGYISGSETGTGSGSITSGLACGRAGVVTASSTYYGFLEIVTLGSNVWVSSGNTWDASVCYTNAGGITLGGTLTQVRVTSVSADTFDAGSINILYEG